MWKNTYIHTNIHRYIQEAEDKAKNQLFEDREFNIKNCYLGIVVNQRTERIETILRCKQQPPPLELKEWKEDTGIIMTQKLKERSLWS